MITFIDGSQLVGKSTLVEGLVNKGGFDSYKFPFGEYSNLFNLSTQEELKGFQLGKDLASLYFISELFDLSKERKNQVLIDRGPMSTVYYSLVLNRMSQTEVQKFFSVLRRYRGEFRFLFITAKNQPTLIRNKKDNFNQLKSQELDNGALSTISWLTKRYGLEFIHFENDFSIPIEDNVLKLYEIIGRG